MGFFTGIACVYRGIARLVASPSLWAYALAPVIATALLLAGLIVAMNESAVEPLTAWARDVVGGAAWTQWVSAVLVWSLVAVALYLVFSSLVRVVAAPFLALLADRTVAQVSGMPSPAAPGGPLVRWVLRPFAEALVVLALRLAITVVALPLLLIPVAGGVAFAVVSMWMVGLDFLDVALSGRGVLLKARLRFVLAHPAACLGLGTGGGLLLFVPCVNMICLPAIVVGAVLLDARLSPDFPSAPAPFPRPVTA